MFKFGDKSKEAYCEYECSKHCEIYDIDGMSKVNDKYACKACYNCALLKLECIHGPALCDLSEFPQEYFELEGEDNNDTLIFSCTCSEQDDKNWHLCETKRRFTLGDILLIIFFIGVSLMLVVSFILLGAYLRSVF